MNAVSPTPRPKPVILAILDGWGHRVETTDNAIALASLPTWTRLVATCPHSVVETSGLDVGLPPGQMGNSEVGHMNIGAGRVMMQDLPRIDTAIEDGSFAKIPALTDFTAKIKASSGTVHLIGLLSPGGVHSHMDQIAALARLIDGAGVPTDLMLAITPGPSRYVESVENPDYVDFNPQGCQSRFEMDVRVQFNTADGRFAEVLDLSLIHI